MARSSHHIRKVQQRKSENKAARAKHRQDVKENNSKQKNSKYARLQEWWNRPHDISFATEIDFRNVSLVTISSYQEL